MVVKKGKKKSSSGGKKKTGSSLAKEVPVDLTLPPITDVKCATLQAMVVNHDLLSLSRLVSHYNYENDLSKVDANGSSLIHIAIKKSDIESLQRLIAFNRINLDIKELSAVGGLTALHIACSLNLTRAVQLLLQGGANPNLKADTLAGETPLMICCKMGYIESARLLIQNRANVNIKDNYGNNASFWASKYQHDNIIRELGLPASRAATAEEFISLLLQKNPNFALPQIKTKTKGKKGDDKKKKK